MRDHHFYIIVALLLLILYCMMNHSRTYSDSDGFIGLSRNWINKLNANNRKLQ